VKRREFITLLGGAAAWSLAARAQQPVMPVIGYLNSGSPDVLTDRVRAFQQGLSETGYVEGHNVAIEYRWAEGQYDRLLSLASDLVRRQVNVIAAGGIPAAQAAKAATETIPIVFQTGVDPVQVGLVTSLNRPGGNLTGATLMTTELVPKRLELLHELTLSATIAVLINPAVSSAETNTKELHAAARTMGLQIHLLHATAERDFAKVFSTLAQLRAGALWIGADPFFNSRIAELAALTLRHAVPAIYQDREFAAAGGLMSYGGRFTDSYRQVGLYAGRILKGQKPADLPVMQPTKFELVLNLKSAKALGLNIPPSLLARADEVIE
jgi:putative ABC transport system substrate-binding protein